MNILLVYPKVATTFWSMDQLMKIIDKKTGYPPLSFVTQVTIDLVNDRELMQMMYKRFLSSKEDIVTN